MSFFEDLNDETLSKYLDEEQMNQLNAISGCVQGVSTGDALIIGLLSMLSGGGGSSGACCSEPQELTSVSNITQFDISLGANATLLLTEDTELQFPTGAKAICTGIIVVEQGGIGFNSLSFAAGYFISSGFLDNISNGNAGDKFQISYATINETLTNVTILPLQ